MFEYTQSHGDLWVRVPTFRTAYLKNIMRSDSFLPLLDLFRHAHDPVKEFTESYSALRHLSAWKSVPKTVYHIGDGVYGRTGALFAFFTKHANVSIDPLVDESKCSEWRDKYSVQRYETVRAKVEDYEFQDAPCLVTLVHAHVNTDDVLDRLKGRWIAAYVCACCHPDQQLKTKHPVLDGGDDWAILSPKRSYRVLVPAKGDYA